MSIFKTKWIVIKKEKIKENEFIYTIFTYDYWKIKAVKKESKKEKMLDLWYLLNFELYLSDKNDLLKIRNIKITWQFDTVNKSFSEINTFLELLNIILKNTPEKIAVYEIYHIFEILKNQETINEVKIILSKLKVLDILGILDINHTNPTIVKILKFIINNNIKNIIKLIWINEELKNELKKI